MDNTEMLGRIRAIILAKGYNEHSYTQYLGISSTTFSDWRRGTNPSLGTVKCIAEDLGKSIDYLVYGKDTAPVAEKPMPETEVLLLGSFRQLPLVLQDRVIAYVQGMVVGNSATIAQGDAIKDARS